VVIPAWKSAPYIARTITSAQAQTLAPVEIIVVVDGSPDDTAAIATACGARVIVQENLGVCAARNNGIQSASGDWIALLDHDDVWLPDKLERQAAAHALRPEVACIACDFRRMQDDVPAKTTVLQEPQYRIDRMTAEPLDDTVMLYPKAGEEFLEAGFFLFPSSMLIRRDLLIDAGMFRAEQRLCEDVDCLLRVLHRTPLLIVHETLWWWREHENNGSRNSTGLSEGWLQLADYVTAHPDRYPAGTLQRMQPLLQTIRRDLVAEYAAQGDFRRARRVTRHAASRYMLTPSEAALAVVVEMPPGVWGMIRRAKRMLLSLFS
jgi:glycosyltransferase involved in cell wall biosynthesis